MAAAAENLSQYALSQNLAVVADGHGAELSAYYLARPLLLGIARRMLGDVMEAEDIVQEVWLRWQSAERETVENPTAFLAQITTRLCLNLTQSSRKRREVSFGMRPPESVDDRCDPQVKAARSEALKLAVLELFQKLSPAQRAAYILREAFEYSYSAIADILQTEEANVRQLVSRARRNLALGRRGSGSSFDQQRLVSAFVVAAQSGDLSALETLFAEDVLSCSRSTKKPLPDVWSEDCDDARAFKYFEASEASRGMNGDRPYVA